MPRRYFDVIDKHLNIEDNLYKLKLRQQKITPTKFKFLVFLSIIVCLNYVRGNEDKFDVLHKHLLTLFYYYYYYTEKQNKQTSKALLLLCWVSKNIHIIKCDILDWQ